MDYHSPALEPRKEFQNRSQQLSMPDNTDGLMYRGVKTACDLDLGNGSPLVTLVEAASRVCWDQITVV